MGDSVNSKWWYITAVVFTAVSIFLMGILAGQAFGQQVEPVPQQALGILPDITVDMSVIVDVLTDYNIEHTTSGFVSDRFYGITSPNNRTIYISDKYDLGDRRDTV